MTPSVYSPPPSQSLFLSLFYPLPFTLSPASDWVWPMRPPLHDPGGPRPPSVVPHRPDTSQVPSEALPPPIYLQQCPGGARTGPFPRNNWQVQKPAPLPLSDLPQGIFLQFHLQCSHEDAYWWKALCGKKGGCGVCVCACACIKKEFLSAFTFLLTCYTRLSNSLTPVFHLYFKLKSSTASPPMVTPVHCCAHLSSSGPWPFVQCVSCGCFLPPCVPVINGRAELGPVSSPLCLLLFWDSLLLSLLLWWRGRTSTMDPPKPITARWTVEIDLMFVALLWAISIRHAKDWGSRSIGPQTHRQLWGWILIKIKYTVRSWKNGYICWVYKEQTQQER